MKALVLKIALILMIFVSNAVAQEVKFEWAKVVGHEGEDIVYSTALDADGNVYATGFFTGEVDFDPGEGEYFLKSILHPNGIDFGDIFIAKYNSNGDFIWAKRIGSGNGDVAYSIAVDKMNNVIVGGGFYQVVDFDPGPNEFFMEVTDKELANTSDIFVCKLDSAGNFIWAKSMGGFNNDFAKAITTDNLGNIYTTGLFWAEGDFDPGADTFKLRSPFAPYTEPDAFVSKLDANGNFVWAKRMGGKYKNWGNSIAVDDFQNVYTVGRFDSTADFDPGNGTFELTSNGAEDIFVSKLDSNGNFVWAKQIGGALTDEGNAIAVDYNRNVIIAGFIQGEVDCDPGAGIEMHNSSEGSDAMIIKLSTDGEFLWGKTFEGSTNCLAKAVTVDALGSIYSTGSFTEKIDFDPGADEYYLQTATNRGRDTIVGNYNVYISKLDYDGNYKWAKQIGSLDRYCNAHGNSIQIVKSGEVYTAGWSSYYNDFNPGEDTLLIQGYGMRDIFIHKMSQTPFFPAPTQLTVEGQDDGFIRLQWQDNSDNEEGFIVERNIGNNGWITLDSTVTNTSFFIDSSVTTGNDIHASYRVYAFEEAEKSGYSNSAGIDIALGITGFENFRIIQAFPNPTTDKIILENPFKTEQNIQIEIYTLEGNLLKEFSLMPQAKLHIDLSKQPQGTYLLKITSGSESFLAKVNVVK